LDSGERAEIERAYERIDAAWARYTRVIAEDDLTTGKIAEVIRWCRNRLGGHDQDLVGPLRWAEACNNGWSERATYACLPSCGPKKTWPRYIHEMAQYVYSMQPRPDGARPFGTRSIGQTRLELELAELVIGWLADEAAGTPRAFPELILSRPTDLRRA